MAQIDRREFLGLLGLAVAVTACAPKTVAEPKYESREEIARRHLQETLDWMNARDNDLITGAASEFSKKPNKAFTWQPNAESDAGVVYLSNSQAQDPIMICIDINELTKPDYQKKDVAISIYSTMYILKNRKFDIRKYETDPLYRRLINFDANSAAQKVFGQSSTNSSNRL
jgi:hypothetical protein